MDLRHLDGIKVYIIESLRSGNDSDKKTGEDLKDTLRQMCVDKGISFSEFDYQYIPINDKQNFRIAFDAIKEEVENSNKQPIIQLECHGYKNGTGFILSSGEKITWKELFDCLRGINIASSNQLLLNLSMCFGDKVICYIDPTKRAPFRGVTCTKGKSYPDDIENAWEHFYNNLVNSSAEYGYSKLAQESNLLYVPQDFIFDLHFNLAYQDPEFFNNLRNRELAKIYLEEGALYIDSALYKKWIAQQQENIKKKYKSYFCFDDIKPIHEAIYNELVMHYSEDEDKQI